MKRIKKIFVISILFCAVARGDDQYSEKTLPKFGNFALRPPQRPFPLYSFAQYILDKGNFQLFNYFDVFRGKQKSKFNGYMTTLIYGVTDRFSVLLNFPFDITARSANAAAPTGEVNVKGDTGRDNIAGLLSVFFQMEYAFYLKYHEQSFNRVTAVCTLSIPPGHPVSETPANVVTPNFFFGFTACHMSVDWYAFISDGFIITTPYRGISRGSTILYQAGVARNLHHFDNWILALMVEGNGYYNRPDRSFGCPDPNSGGNLIYIGPSIFASQNNVILQLGTMLAAYHKPNGNQPKQSFWLSFGCAYTF